MEDQVAEHKYKVDVKNMVKNKWKEKPMHGKFPKYLDKDHIETII